MMMSGLEPANIAKEVEAKSKKNVRPPSELEMKKEERMFKKEERLTQIAQGPKGKKVTIDEDLPPPPDPSVILDKIEAYRDRFPNLKSRNKISARSSLAELIDELHYLELQLGSASKSVGGSLGCMILQGTMSGIEVVTQTWNPLKLNLQGLGQVTKDNMTEFEPIVDELMIKYGAGMYMSPELRLCMLIGSTCVTVHMANSGDPRIAEALKKMNKVVNDPSSSSDL